MHKIAEKEFTLEDFSTEQLCEIGSEDIALLGEEAPYYKHRFELYICSELNFARRLYLAADKKLKREDLTASERKHVTAQRKKFWWQMIQLLPSSYNQTRNVMLNYEVLANIYRQRKGHKLDEWREFCKWIETLPYSELITDDIKILRMKIQQLNLANLNRNTYTAEEFLEAIEGAHRAFYAKRDNDESC